MLWNCDPNLVCNTCQFYDKYNINAASGWIIRYKIVHYTFTHAFMPIRLKSELALYFVWLMIDSDSETTTEKRIDIVI